MPELHSSFIRYRIASGLLLACLACHELFDCTRCALGRRLRQSGIVVFVRGSRHRPVESAVAKRMVRPSVGYMLPETHADCTCEVTVHVTMLICFFLMAVGPSRTCFDRSDARRAGGLAAWKSARPAALMATGGRAVTLARWHRRIRSRFPTSACRKMNGAFFV